MQALDLDLQMPIEYLLEKNNQDTFYKVLECSLQADFDVFVRPVDYSPGKTGSTIPASHLFRFIVSERTTTSFWDVLKKSKMCTP